MKKTTQRLLVALLPMLVGCKDLEKPSSGSQGKKTDLTQLKSAQTTAESTPNQTAAILDFPKTDPLLAGAIETRDQIVRHEEELLDRLNKLRELIDTAKTDPHKLPESVSEFVKLAKALRLVSAKANEALGLMIDRANELVRSMRHLEQSYFAAADLFRRKVSDYQEAKFKAQLLGFAADYEAIAQSIPERQERLEQFQQALPNLKNKTREARAFLDDAILYLNSHPEVGVDPRTRYGEQFEAFANTFSDWLRVLDELRSLLRHKALSQRLYQDLAQEQCVAKQREQNEKAALAKIEQEKLEEETRLALWETSRPAPPEVMALAKTDLVQPLPVRTIVPVTDAAPVVVTSPPTRVTSAPPNLLKQQPLIITRVQPPPVIVVREVIYWSEPVRVVRVGNSVSVKPVPGRRIR